MTQNPVAFAFDDQGHIYIAEGWRNSRGAIAIVDARMNRANALRDDLAATHVDDRLALINRLIAGGYFEPTFFTEYADKVRLLKDTDGDGVADKSALFADGFNDKLDGFASGVLYLDGKVYLTNIPHLWLLQDKDGDGDADESTDGERVSLSFGYGVRFAYGGHDLHGLTLGHDGRIYFSMGDRGYNITTREGKQLYGPDRGAVFRMWPDGSELEVFHTGLRNPQELAFDNYGNLFTGDNDSDSEDLARFCYLPEGGDAGWRQDVQSLPSRGPWNRERMWEPRLDSRDMIQPAWIIHPLAADVGRGPSGLVHYPGTGDVFPANGSFLMCDYPPGIRHVRVEPKGAGFVVTEDSSFVDGQTISDIAWGYDGRLYLSDWGGGWSVNPRGYIKTMTNRAAHDEQAEVIEQIKTLFAEGFKKLSDEQLIALLGHRDQRVRLRAQWQLGTREVQHWQLTQVLEDPDRFELAKVHAVWAMAMQCRNRGAGGAELADKTLKLALVHKSPHVRAQAYAMLGDLAASYPKYSMFLNHVGYSILDEELTRHPVVLYHATIALGKTGDSEHIVPLLDLLDQNNNEDTLIRHAASYALACIGDIHAIHAQAQRRGAAARLGTVLALRRLDSPLLADYLEDADSRVAVEAARAIYDRGIIEVFPALAALTNTLEPDQMIEPVMRRVIEANVRLADRASADRLARLAANEQAPEPWRLLALRELDGWSEVRERGGVWGAWRPRPKQPMDEAVAALQSQLPVILNQPTGDVTVLARIMQQRHITKAGPDAIAAIVANDDEPMELRLAVVEQLIAQDRPLAARVCREVVEASGTPLGLRTRLREILLSLDPDAALASSIRAAKSGGAVADRQHAIAQLRKLNQPEAYTALAELAEQLEQGELPAELRLDVYQAVATQEQLPTEARAAAKAYAQANTVPGEEPLIRDALIAGGSAEIGEALFRNHPAAQCARCHHVNGQDNVGPDLSTIGSLHPPGYLLTALIKPEAHIAAGYASTSVTLKDGSIKTGRIVKHKSTPAALVLANSDGVEQSIDRRDIQGVPVTSTQSLMPTMKDKLTASELRDVLAYLVSLKHEGGKPAGPTVVSPAKDLPHHIVLPIILLAIFVTLGVLLLATVLGGGAFQA